MKIGELLYFAPGVTFNEVQFHGPALPAQLERRIRGFYLEPAERCAEAGFAFAAGVLLMTCIDALARFRYGNDGNRFRFFAKEALTSFCDEEHARQFHRAFRHGLIH